MVVKSFPLLVSVMLAFLYMQVSASSAFTQKINSNIRNAQLSIISAQAELMELSETLGTIPLFGPKTLLSAHWYTTDVTDIMGANMKGGRLVFPGTGQEGPANALFGNPHRDVYKALVVTWIDDTMRFQKRAFKQEDIETPTEWGFRGCHLWDE